MAKTRLNSSQKHHIGECYSGGAWTKAQLADLYSVDRKTIHRVLKELNLLTDTSVPVYTLDPASARIVEVVKAHGLDAESLYQTLNAPALTRDNIIKTLANLKLGDINSLLEEVLQAKSAANVQHKEITDDQADPDASL